MRQTLLALLFVPLPLAAQQVTLAYRLGKDTVAIEQYAHQNSRISGVMVQRAGAAVTVTRYEMAYGSNGRPTSAKIARSQPDGSPLPNQPIETRFTVFPDSVVREVVRADSTSRATFAVRGATIAFPVYVYGPTEVLAAIHRRGPADSIPALGLVGGPGFLGIERVGGDTLRLRGAPYPMRLVFDASNRLMVMDGGMTTNKMIATRDGGSVDVMAIARAMKPTGTLSARDVARGAFGPGGIVLVDYGRPMVRERTVWGGALVPFDSVWRAGANDATHLFTTRTLTFGELTVPPGSYSLWIQHTRTGTFLIVNKQIGQWGTVYDPAQDVGRAAMQVAPAPGHVEEMTVTVRSVGGNRGVIDFAWGDKVVSAPFTATAR
ncbi:MAG TPA: DUF2911 domain-containing protein [Gemmatimonadaceae bacterium]